MALKQAIIVAIVRQFGRPRGAAGNAAGWVMAHRTSNRQRNTRMVSLLAIQPTERVLEVGFGPGLAIAELSRRVAPGGHVFGIDHSKVMVRQASRRNAAAIQAGTVTLTIGGVEQLPPGLDGPFDAILAVNSLGFWATRVERLEDLRQRLTPGGRIAIASQPRGVRTRMSASDLEHEITDLLRAAGFRQTGTEILDLDPPVVCVLAVNRDSTRA
jgi:SAM-dependent methyltransferase